MRRETTSSGTPEPSDAIKPIKKPRSGGYPFGTSEEIALEFKRAPDSASSPQAIDFRKRAEAKLRATRAAVSAPPSDDDKHVLHELQIHQIELEMQNEELRCAQAELEASRSRYFDLYDLAPVGYCTVSEKGLILEANLTAAFLFGMAKGALVQQSISRFIHHKEDQDTYHQCCQQLLNTRTPQVCELRMAKRDGTAFWARVETSGDRNAAGTLVYRMVITDITAHKRAEDAMQNVQRTLETRVADRTQGHQRAEEARCKAEGELAEQRTIAVRADRLRSLGEMAAGIAHELNQPLSGVRALAEQNLIALRKKWVIDPADLTKELQLIVDQCDRMSRIIKHVRLFAREAGKPETQSCSMNEILEGSLELIRAQLRTRGIVVTLELAQHLPPVDVNPFSMEEVFLNLLSNARHAIKSAHPDADSTITLKTSVITEGGRTWVSAEVGDNGTGLSAEVMDRAFEPFYTTKGPDEGTGLGLSICRSIVESYGGIIRLVSTPGTGATAIVLLPTGPTCHEAGDRP